MDVLQQFKQRVEDALTRLKMTPSELGKLALGDPGFVFGLRAGRSPQMRTVMKVDTFIQERDAARKAQSNEAA